MSGEDNAIIPVGGKLPPISPPGQSGNKTKRQGTRPLRLRGVDRFSMLNEFIDSGMAGLSRLEALVWLVLFRDARGDIAESSSRYLAVRIGVNPRSVIRALVKLHAKGFIIVRRKGGLNQGANIYQLRSRMT